MIKFEMFHNIDHNGCSYCGGIHKEMIQIEEDSHAGAGNHFIMGRRCLKKFAMEAEKFLRLHASGTGVT